MEKQILGPRDMERILTRMAYEILERYTETDRLALVGIHTRGVFLARRLASLIQEISEVPVMQGTLDITLYRDDWTRIAQHPVLRSTDIPFDVDGMDVVLVDDVLYTGRTTRAGMDALIDFGRPRCIGLAVLVDRGHRELPVHADFVGRYVETAKGQTVNVRVVEEDGEDLVLVEVL
ncbi:bifunctional pyr operon transcriptional regulator/uracil phosphoribosyltransferase PyrR [Desulfobotulus sp. H1]|uniref:Bifunctional protein PyrR n=1 Tax=Desulfobotulus pelophilus TaxID=2823377 RepID=A0ABT3NBH7_9BACT|nr:bifunctional pyr operon transcriptional regulator/uracil phosphoribosyltransferase PyrR [Desulfobotulus pelophilus]MCW7754823.1 bifunctional pyr operon transcriptional regulator/uracil phosphoribosyltransferase PyrR [Desulfobotulus pelophilus]